MRRFPLALAALLAACSPDELTRTARDRGELAFQQSEAGAPPCAACHAATPGQDTRLLTGAPLAGAVDRPSFWGGKRTDLLASINDCRSFFQKSAPWAASDPAAQNLYAFLQDLSPGSSAPQPFTLPPTAVDLSPGDAARGADIYARACQGCHGAAQSGDGRAYASPALPEPPIARFTALGLDATQRRLAFIEKTRHGVFGLEGTMPPFSTEALSDAQLADLLAFFGL